MNIIVIGKNGQVSSHLRYVFDEKAQYIPRSELDLTNVGSVYDSIFATNADIIINAAAYTDTKLAESEQGLAYAVNAASVAEIARAANDINALFIHISTDYVFDGTKEGAYIPHDTPHPISVYGASKLLGEQLIAQLCPQHVILRTSWVFSEHGNNFVKTIANLAQSRDSLDIVANQKGCPTYAGHLAKVIAELVMRYQYKQKTNDTIPVGTYHYADTAVCSWYEFAQAIVLHLTEIDTGKNYAKLVPINSNDWPSPIKRPENGALDCQSLVDDWGIKRYHWKDVLTSVLLNLK